MTKQPLLLRLLLLRPLGTRTIAVVGWLIAASVSTAHASVEYNQALDDALDAACPSNCTWCHSDSAGDFDTVTRPFGQAMMTEGELIGLTPTRVADAIERLRSAETDSDGDGISDITEIENNGSPNGDAFPICPPEPIYGCPIASVSPAVSTTARPRSGPIALALGLLLWRRLRRSRDG